MSLFTDTASDKALAASRRLARFHSLTTPQQEMFMSLLPTWHCPLDELFDAVTILSE